MGLAAPRKRRKFNLDPENTAWSRSTTSYGHRQLLAQGWTPGQSLGAVDAPRAGIGRSGIIRTVVREENLGLGAKGSGGGGGGGQALAVCTGLDSFQRLLGKLNGKSEEELDRETAARDRVRGSAYVQARYGGLRWVSGGLLVREGQNEQEGRDETGRTGNLSEPNPLPPSPLPPPTPSVAGQPSRNATGAMREQKRGDEKPVDRPEEDKEEDENEDDDTVVRARAKSKSDSKRKSKSKSKSGCKSQSQSRVKDAETTEAASKPADGTGPAKRGKRKLKRGRSTDETREKGVGKAISPSEPIEDAAGGGPGEAKLQDREKQQGEEGEGEVDADADADGPSHDSARGTQEASKRTTKAQRQEIKLRKRLAKLHKESVKTRDLPQHKEKERLLLERLARTQRRLGRISDNNDRGPEELPDVPGARTLEGDPPRRPPGTDPLVTDEVAARAQRTTRGEQNGGGGGGDDDGDGADDCGYTAVDQGKASGAKDSSSSCAAPDLTTTTTTTTAATRPHPPPPSAPVFPSHRHHAARSRYIRQKKLATMDSRALNEILMVKA